MSDFDVYDESGNLITGQKSFIEKTTKLETYEELVSLVTRMATHDDGLPRGDGKTYSPAVGRGVWKVVILATKPHHPKTHAEESLLTSIYKMLYHFAKAGEYPLLQQLCNYLGVSIDEFFATMETPNHPNREVYLWAYSVFESAATMNAIRSNGNANIRVWLDKSRERKMATEDKMELAIEARKIDKLEEHGADIAKEMLEE